MSDSSAFLRSVPAAPSQENFFLPISRRFRVHASTPFATQNAGRLPGGALGLWGTPLPTVGSVCMDGGQQAAFEFQGAPMFDDH